MSEWTSEAWKWLKTAPLPVVLALTLGLGTWVWHISNHQIVQDSDVRIETQRMDIINSKVDKIDAKLDDLLGLAVELRVRVEDAKLTAAANRIEDRKKERPRSN